MGRLVISPINFFINRVWSLTKHANNQDSELGFSLNQNSHLFFWVRSVRKSTRPNHLHQWINVQIHFHYFSCFPIISTKRSKSLQGLFPSTFISQDLRLLNESAAEMIYSLNFLSLLCSGKPSDQFHQLYSPKVYSLNFVVYFISFFMQSEHVAHSTYFVHKAEPTSHNF